MFMELGMILDHSINSIKIWNAQRVWYKIYAHFYILKKIKINFFGDDEHFEYFMDMALKNNRITDWQYRRMYKLYYKSRGI